MTGEHHVVVVAVCSRRLAATRYRWWIVIDSMRLAPLAMTIIVKERVLVQISGVIVHSALFDLLFPDVYRFRWAVQQQIALIIVIVSEWFLSAVSHLFFVRGPSSRVSKLFLKCISCGLESWVLIISTIGVDALSKLPRALLFSINCARENAVDEQTLIEWHLLAQLRSCLHLVLTLHVLSLLFCLEKVWRCRNIRLLTVPIVNFLP